MTDFIRREDILFTKNDILFTKNCSKAKALALDAFFEYCIEIRAKPSEVRGFTRFGNIAYWAADSDIELYLQTKFYDIPFYRTGKISEALPLESLSRAVRPETPYEFISRLAPVQINEEKVVRRLPKALFFQPFGIPKGGFNERCRRTVQFTKNIMRYLERYGVEPELLLMPADSYAIEINGYSPGVVDRFVQDMEEMCPAGKKPKTTVVRWSKIREDNKRRYDELVRAFKPSDDLIDKLKERAMRYSHVLGSKSAPRYASERFAEGIIIDETLQPIKISAANTDVDELDGPLPRIYPAKMPRFSWLPSKWND